MKIVFTTTIYLPHIGGIEIYIHTLAQYLINRGDNVVIIVADKSCSAIGIELVEGERILRLPAKEVGGFFFLKDKKSIRYVKKEISDADVVHVNVSKFLYSYFAKQKKRENHYRLIVTSHGWLYHTRKHKLFKDVYFRYIISKYATLYDAIINISIQDQRIAENFGITNTYVIENGVDIYKFSGLKPKDKYEGKFLYWGRIAPNKGIYECLVKLSTYDENYEFAIIGNCDDKEYEKKLNYFIRERNLEKNVLFKGKLSDAEIRSYIENTDFILMPSLHEGFGMTLAECLLSERPIIANINDAFKSILKSVEAEQYLFNYVDSNTSIKEKITELLNNKITPRNVNQFSAETMIKRTIEFYDD